MNRYKDISIDYGENTDYVENYQARLEEDRLHAEAIEAEENEEVLTEQPPGTVSESFVPAFDATGVEGPVLSSAKDYGEGGRYE